MTFSEDALWSASKGVASMHPVVIQHSSVLFRAVMSSSACGDWPHTGHQYSAVEKRSVDPLSTYWRMLFLVMTFCLVLILCWVQVRVWSNVTPFTHDISS